MLQRLILILALTLSLVSVSDAATFRAGNEIIISKRTVIHSNLVATGKKIHIYGTIRGDVIAAGEEIVIEGRVYGDIIAAGKIVRIQPRDVEDIRVAGQEVFISTYTGKDVFVAGQYLTLSNNNFVGGDAVLMGQSIKLGGYIAGGLKAHGESVVQDPGLYVRKAREIVESKHELRVSRKMMALGVALAAGFKLYHLVVLWGVLWLMLKFRPVFLWGVQKTMDGHVLKSAGVAFLALLLLPFLWVLFGISLVGIPLIPISIAGVIFLSLIYKINLALWIGQKITELPMFDRSRPSKKRSKGFRRSPHLLFWLGMAVIFLLKLIPVIGGLICFFAFFWVLGAYVLQIYTLSQTLMKKKLI